MIEEKKNVVVIPPEIDEILEEWGEKPPERRAPFYDLKWVVSYLTVFFFVMGILIALSAPLGAWNTSSLLTGSGGNVYDEPPSGTGHGKWDSYDYEDLKEPQPRKTPAMSGMAAGAAAGAGAAWAPGEIVSLDPSQLGSTELKGKCGFEQLEPAGQVQGVRVLAGPMSQYGSLYKLLKAAGLSPNEGLALQKAMEKLLDIKVMRAEDQVALYVKEEGSVFWFLDFKRSETTVYHFLKMSGGGIDAHQVQFPTRKEWSKAGGVVHGSLYRSVEQVGLDGSIAGSFMEVLGAYIDFTKSTRDGDLFKVIVSSEWIGKKFMAYDAPQAIYYKGAKAGEITAIRFPAESETAKYYKPDGMALKEVLSEVPLRSIRISSPFDLKRLHPILKVIKPHTGTDLAAPTGTPVFAYSEGLVKVAKLEGLMGNMVLIEHGGGVSSYYGHLNGFASGIKSGVGVKRGQLIGYVGTTGRSTGPHLHFAVKKGGSWVDPMKLLTIKTTSEQMIDPSFEEAFFKRAKTMMAFMAAIGTEEEGSEEGMGGEGEEEEGAEEEEAGQGQAGSPPAPAAQEKKEEDGDWNSEW